MTSNPLLMKKIDLTVAIVMISWTVFSALDYFLPTHPVRGAFSGPPFTLSTASISLAVIVWVGVARQNRFAFGFLIFLGVSNLACAIAQRAGPLLSDVPFISVWNASWQLGLAIYCWTRLYHLKNPAATAMISEDPNRASRLATTSSDRWKTPDQYAGLIAIVWMIHG